jgi:hypothetical protein
VQGDIYRTFGYLCLERNLVRQVVYYVFYLKCRLLLFSWNKVHFYSERTLPQSITVLYSFPGATIWSLTESSNYLLLGNLTVPRTSTPPPEPSNKQGRGWSAHKTTIGTAEHIKNLAAAAAIIVAVVDRRGERGYYFVQHSTAPQKGNIGPQSRSLGNTRANDRTALQCPYLYGTASLELKMKSSL